VYAARSKPASRSLVQPVGLSTDRTDRDEWCRSRRAAGALYDQVEDDVPVRTDPRNPTGGCSESWLDDVNASRTAGALPRCGLVAGEGAPADQGSERIVSAGQPGTSDDRVGSVVRTCSTYRYPTRASRSPGALSAVRAHRDQQHAAHCKPRGPNARTADHGCSTAPTRRAWLVWSVRGGEIIDECRRASGGPSANAY